jgi:predicted  nucleic acid-binding Zn-ribbon protein
MSSAEKSAIIMSPEFPVDELILTKFEEVNNLMKSYNELEENICRLNTEINSLRKNIKDKENTKTELYKNQEDLSILISYKKQEIVELSKKL